MSNFINKEILNLTEKDSRLSTSANTEPVRKPVARITDARSRF